MTTTRELTVEVSALLADAAEAENRGRPGAARACYEAALRRFDPDLPIAAEVRNGQLVASIEQHLGAVAESSGDCEGALAHYSASLQWFTEQGLVDGMGPLLSSIGRLEIDTGQPDQAVETLAEAIRQCVASGDIRHEVLARIDHARAEMATGDWAAAERSCLQSRDRAEAAGDSTCEALIVRQLGAVAAAKGEADLALEYLLEAHGLADSRADVVLLGDIAVDLARLHRSRGRNRAALDALLGAHGRYKCLQEAGGMAELDLRFARFESDLLAVVQEWGESVDGRDPHTEGRCARVAAYAMQLAESAGLDPQTLIWFKVGALLHDIGKAIIPYEILNKPGKLTAEEFDLVQQHPAAGEAVLTDVDFPWDILPMVRHHHERWDGAGYPDGLSGDQIPLPARILCVADVFDAVTTNRPYRSAIEIQIALDIMEGESGGAFDPELHALFMELIESNLLAPHLTAQVAV